MTWGRPACGWPVVWVFGAALGAGAAAHADEFDTLNFNAGASVMYNDNVFYLRPGADPNVAVGQPSGADRINVNSLGVSLNKPYALQRFELGVNFVDYKYRTFDFLSFTATNFNGAWRWSLTPRFRGNLTASQNEALNSFVDFRSLVRNVRTDQNLRFDVEYEVDGARRLIGAVGNQKVTNEQLFIQQQDFRSAWSEAGVKYAFPSGSYASVLARKYQGDYFKIPAPIPAALFDNRFDQQDLEGRFLWNFSGKSSFDSRLAYIKREHPTFSERNYSGAVGYATLSWNITDKTHLVGTLARDITSYQQISSSYIRMHTLSIGPAWELGYKATLRARYNMAIRDFFGAVAATPQNDRSDKMHTAFIGLDWQPRRFVTLSASFQNEKRASNLPGFDYNTITTSISAQLTF